MVYKLDRAARNLEDYVELEDLEEQGLQLIVVTQPTEDNPAGQMMRQTSATPCCAPKRRASNVKPVSDWPT